MQAPFITVIIPNFNYEAYVGECVQSVLSQDYSHFEVIVVDDGSRDGSWDVIQSFGSRIKALRVENGGALRACLAATDIARGDYIYILDSDDRLSTTRALSQIAEVCKTGPSKVQFALQPVDGDGAPIGQVFPQLSADVTSADLIAAVLDNGCYTSPPTSGNVYRRDVWEVARTVDYETWTDGVVYLLCPFRGEVVSLPMALAEYRIHGRNDSTAPATGGRFQREADRFAKRLEHLRTLVSPEHAARLKPADQYFFFNERLVLDKTFGERSFGRQTILRTLRSLVGQRQSTGRMLFMMAWFLSLTVAPKRLRLKLASLRQKPLYSLRLLGMLKRLS